jgi:DNA-binding transcriptional LysR family regulator
MDLKQLRAFAAAAEHGTVSKAALHLHASQPALSRQIIDLEKELGIALFDRVGRRLRLTGAGAQFLASSRNLLAQARSLSDEARELRAGDSGVLRVAASPQMIDNVFGRFLHRYGEHYPQVQVRLVEGIGCDVPALIESGDVMLGTVGDDAIPPGTGHFGRLYLLPVTFSAAHAHPFHIPRQRLIDVRSLTSFPLLLLDSSFILRRTFDAACRLARVRPDIRFECSSPHTLLSLAEAGHGVAVVPSNVLLHRYSLKTVPISVGARLLQEPLSIFWDSRRSLPRYASDFCRLLAVFVRDVIPAPAQRRAIKRGEPRLR